MYGGAQKAAEEISHRVLINVLDKRLVLVMDTMYHHFRM